MSTATRTTGMLVIALLCAILGCRPSSNPGGAGSNSQSANGRDPDLGQTAGQASTASDLTRARMAMQRGHLDQAGTLIRSYLVQFPEDATALEMAGDIASAQSDLPQAIQWYRSAVDVSKPASPQLYDKLARSWMNDGAPYEAAEVLRQSIAAHPDVVKTRSDFAGLIASLGMVRDAAEHLRWLLRRGHGGLNELIMLADLTIPQTDRAICEYALRHRPNDLRPRYPLALETAYQGDYQSAATQLKEVTEKHPEFAVAWAHYGRALVEIGDEEAFGEWASSVPAGTDSWPAYWVAAGLWAEKHSRPEMAASAFWHVIQIDESHGEALTHLAANLAQINRSQDSKTVAERAAAVRAMRDQVESLFSWRRNSQQAALQIAESMNGLGRVWEAEAWARASLMMTQQLVDDARQQHLNYYRQLASSTPWQLPDHSIRKRVDLASLPKFQWDMDAVASNSNVDHPRRILEPLRFVDEAVERGLIHTCSISKTRPEASLWIYQSTVGGAGVIDFDLDGWPDLYLTRADGEPLERNSHSNRLWRNQTASFVDVTVNASAGDPGFAQGIAVGDYNSDGFPDLLIGNIGENRLLRNNGDGTFADVTEAVGLSGKRWTTSLAVADLDGDAIADLFEVNYCSGTTPFRQPCMDHEVQEARSCSPLVFSAELDRVWRGKPEGGFTDATDQWLPDAHAGHGLGLVIGQLDLIGGVDAYVANDMTANQYWSVVSENMDSENVDSGDNGTRFQEQAAVRGLAVNRRSQSQASMGIAVADPDHDGDFDLFLTHFTDDHNTYYEQIQPGTWFDRSDVTGLGKPSQDRLAFGTEWMDANNDGDLELIVANGNVDDFQHQGHPLRMRSQYFVPDGPGHWQEAKPGDVGDYFAQPKIGRALVTVDLDRDARQDAVVTHLFDPVAALMNRTESVGRAIRIRLVGTHSHRDAIGTVARLDVGGRRVVVQPFAGDGFQCSNERWLWVPLGVEDRAGDVTITWPDGTVESIGELPAGWDYLIIQGDGAAYPVARFPIMNDHS